MIRGSVTAIFESQPGLWSFGGGNRRPESFAAALSCRTRLRRGFFLLDSATATRTSVSALVRETADCFSDSKSYSAGSLSAVVSPF